jgi:hypothetical protein
MTTPSATVEQICGAFWLGPRPVERMLPKRVGFETRAAGPKIKARGVLESRSQNVGHNAMLAVCRNVTAARSRNSAPKASGPGAVAFFQSRYFRLARYPGEYQAHCGRPCLSSRSRLSGWMVGKQEVGPPACTKGGVGSELPVTLSKVPDWQISPSVARFSFPLVVLGGLAGFRQCGTLMCASTPRCANSFGHGPVARRRPDTPQRYPPTTRPPSSSNHAAAVRLPVPRPRLSDADDDANCEWSRSPFKSFPAKIPAKSLGKQSLSVFCKVLYRTLECFQVYCCEIMSQRWRWIE